MSHIVRYDQWADDDNKEMGCEPIHHVIIKNPGQLHERDFMQWMINNKETVDLALSNASKWAHKLLSHKLPEWVPHHSTYYIESIGRHLPTGDFIYRFYVQKMSDNYQFLS